MVSTLLATVVLLMQLGELEGSELKVAVYPLAGLAVTVAVDA
jgi:hypothetical protein